MTLIGCAVVVAGYAADWSTIHFARLELGDFVSRLAALLLFALLIERTVEVSLTIWRAEESYKFIVPVGSHIQGAPSGNQLWWFHLPDIVLTAALLAGATAPIHKLMDAFWKFMEAASAKASGTSN